MSRKHLGRPAKFDDLFHTVMAERQRKYDSEIYRIRRERKCSFAEAQAIRRELRIKAGKRTNSGHIPGKKREGKSSEQPNGNH